MQKKILVKIGHLKITDHLILGVTENRVENSTLLFNRLDLENCPENSWSQVIENLLEGKTNGAFIPAPVAMDLFDKGAGIKLILFTHRSGSKIVKNRAANIQTLQDFQGKTILTPHALSMQSMLCHKLLSSAGLKFGSYDKPDTDVFMEVVSPNIMPEMLKEDQTGDIGGFVVAEPFGSIAVRENIAEPLCSTEDLWKNHPCCVFVVLDEIVNEYPLAVEELTAAFLGSAQIIDQKNDDTLLPVAGYFLDQETEIVKQSAFQADQNFKPDMLVPDIKALEIIQDYMVNSMGVLASRISLDDLVYKEFALKTLMEK